MCDQDGQIIGSASLTHAHTVQPGDTGDNHTHRLHADDGFLTRDETPVYANELATV